MRNQLVFLTIGVTLSLSVVAGLAVAQEGDGNPSGAATVFLGGADSIAELNQVLVGQGVAGTDVPEAFVAAAGRIAWRQVRDQADELGMRHLFYRQVLKPAGALASTVEAPYAADGIELEGAEIGVHWYSDGTLRATFGTQFLDVVLLNQPVITSATDAWSVAQAVLGSWPGFEPADPASWAAETIASQVAAARLALRPDGDGRSFTFVWRLPVVDARGKPFSAVMDAATAQVLSVTDATAGAICGPADSETSTAAKADPQNDAIADRNLWATPTSQRGDFTYEGYRPATTGQIPKIEVYHGTETSPWTCDTSDEKWALLPIKYESGYPWYKDYASPYSVPGRAAGDAAYFTYLTMQTFKNTFGWHSYDGNGGIARVVVEGLKGDYPVYDQAIFASSDWGALPWVMPNAVGISRKSSGMDYSYAACLDVVAHEWGHGVTSTTAQFDRDTAIGRQLDEGFADVIGYAVERLNQSAASCEPCPPLPASCTPAPPNSCYEKADWLFGEDNPWANFRDAVKRRVDSPTPNYGMAFHKDQLPGNDDAYIRGNQLGVVFYLLTQGGTNPGCSGETGCSTYVTGLGLASASKVLFRTLAYYTWSSVQWWQLRHLAMAAAFDLFSRCSPCYLKDDALAQQGSVHDAFTAIGYTGALDYSYCECP